MHDYTEVELNDLEIQYRDDHTVLKMIEFIKYHHLSSFISFEEFDDEEDDESDS